MAWLTWQGVRALATCEALVPESGTVQLAEPDPARPPIKWASQRHWFDTAIPHPSQAGDAIYARTAWRHSVRGALVCAVTAPSVLVSSFYDPTIYGPAVAEVCAPTSQIRHWFGVQVGTTHPRLTAMPVGVEADNVPLFEATERHTTRDILLYLNFSMDRATATRHLAWRHFAPLPWVTAERPGPAAHYVAQLGRSRFVLSPPGFGWDCYRTYEALVMGAIPIVIRQPPQSDVCESLPVLMVNHWREITPERLQREWETRTRPRDLRKLTLEYWRERIQAEAQRCLT